MIDPNAPQSRGTPDANMDRSPKRRKVSMTRSIDISPIKIAADTSFSATQISPSRPSYMSPTRASLARTNPELLPPPRRSLALDGANEDVYDMMNIGKEPRTSSKRLNPTPLRNTTPNRGSPTAAARADAELDSQRTSRGKGKRVSFAPAADDALDSQLVEKENIPSARSQQPRGSNGASVRSTRTSEDKLAELEAELTGPLGDDGEPELPELPTPDTPYGPPGLLSSSPSGQAARRLTTRRSMLPPLSRRESSVPVAQPGSEQEPRSDRNDVENGIQQDAGNDDDDEPVSPQADETVEDFEEELEDDSIPLLPSGPIILRNVSLDSKRDELKALLREQRRLDEEVQFLEEVCMFEDDNDGTSKANNLKDSRVLDIILHGQAQSSNSREGANDTVSARLARLLPFGETEPLPVQAQKETQDQDASTSALQTAKNNLQNLFTPLQLTNSQSTAFFEDKHMQMHQLSITSPNGLLKLAFDYQIDPVDGRVFRISENERSDWSDPELGEFIKQYSGGEMSFSTCDLNTIGFATNQYWHLTQLRAKTWDACIRKHKDLVIDAQSDKETEASKASSGDRPASAHLGRQTLRLEKDGVGLLVTWKIDFEWTGDARSQVSACAAFPKSWRDRDNAGSFEHVGELFELFTRRFGVQIAVAHLVEVMFENEG